MVHGCDGIELMDRTVTYGMTNEEFAAITEVFVRFPEVESAILYGSRAKGTNSRFSDIDITLIGDRITRPLLCDLAACIDNLLLPYEVELSVKSWLTYQPLIDEIDQTGVIIYSAGR